MSRPSEWFTDPENFYECDQCEADFPPGDLCSGCYSCSDCGHDEECPSELLEQRLAAGDWLLDHERHGD